MAETNRGITSALSPFDRASGDIIIRTSDDVDFRVHKDILSIASPWFESTLSLDKPPPSDATTSNTAPIAISEDSPTFDALLRLVYPVADPPLTANLTLVEDILQAAIKYEMEEAITLCLTALRTYLYAQPLAVFSIACRLHVEEMAKLAAETWKKQQRWESSSSAAFKSTMAGASYTPEMGDLSAGAYFRLLDFLRTDPDPEVKFSCPGDPASLAPVENDDAVYNEDEANPDDHYFANADILLRSYDEVDVPAHHLILRLASAELLLADTVTTDSEGRTIYRVRVNGQTLRLLVRLCYPFARLPTHALSSLDALMEAAAKYEITKVKELIKEYCVRALPAHPLLIYFLAVKWEWTDEIRKACKLVAEQGVKDAYVQTMENAFAHEYVQLLKFCHEYTLRVSHTVRRYNPSSCQWRKVVNEDIIIPKLVCLPLVEQASQNHFCYPCMQGYNQKSDCSCRTGEFEGLIRDSKTLQDAIDKTLDEVKLPMRHVSLC